MLSSDSETSDSINEINTYAAADILSSMATSGIIVSKL